MGEKMGEDAEAEAMARSELEEKARAVQSHADRPREEGTESSELEARKNKLKAEGKYGHEKSEKSEEEKPKRAAAGSKKARAKR